MMGKTGKERPPGGGYNEYCIGLAFCQNFAKILPRPEQGSPNSLKSW